MTDTTGGEAPLSDALVLGPYRLSWTAYIRPALGLIFMLFAGSVLGNFSPLFGWIMTLLGIGLAVLTVVNIRVVEVYADDAGVWMRSGFLPWEKGVTGVKWRDIDQALFFRGLFAWAFKSYEVQVAHRYTQSSELRIKHLHLGDEAVMQINQHHQNRVRADL